MENNTTQREGFSSNWGFMLAVIGIAVGLGNLWRFPYMIGMFGGGAWLITYIGIVLLITFPALTAEWVLGRNTQSGPLGAFLKSGFPKGKWVGLFFAFAIYMCLYYYLPVTTYVFMYIFASIFGLFAIDPSGFFGTMSSNIPLVFACEVVVIGLIAYNLLFGVKGIEKASKIMTPLFFIFLGIVGIRALTLDGAVSGTLEFMAVDWSKLDGAALMTSMGQAFFSLSLGGTLMVTYSSYMSKKASIPQIGGVTAFGDLLGALFCFGVVVPGAFAAGIAVNSGPSLLFVTLPSIFTQMPGGMLFSTLSFAAMYFVVHMSMMSGIEVISTVTMENFGWARKKSIIIFSIITLILSIPVLFSETFLIYSDLFWGSIMQPLGCVFAMIAVGWFMGRSRALGELKEGSQLNLDGVLGKIWFAWVRYVIPAVVIGILMYSLVTWF